jgi:hypothetical protein
MSKKLKDHILTVIISILASGAAGTGVFLLNSSASTARMSAETEAIEAKLASHENSDLVLRQETNDNLREIRESVRDVHKLLMKMQP